MIGGVNVTPKLLAIAAVVVVVIFGAIYLSMGSNSSSGGFTFTPSTFSCSSTAKVTMTIRLPSSVTATEKLTWKVDSQTLFTGTVSDLGLAKQSDGSWMYTSTDSGSGGCADVTGMGAHTMSVLDPAGHILAQGSFTVTP